MDPERLTMEAAIDRVAHAAPSFVAIDGLPCSGKSALAERLRERLRAVCIELDEFVLPADDWPKPMKPAFPFEYVRYAAFVEAVQALATVGVCSYQPFDWSTYRLARDPRIITRETPVIVEGVSSLSTELSALFDVRVFIESDRLTTREAARQGVPGDGVANGVTFFCLASTCTWRPILGNARIS
jgi:uridine kinase